MNLLVPDLRKQSRRKPDKLSPDATDAERRKVSDRRTDEAEPVRKKVGKRIWLTPKQKALLEDLFFLEEKG